MGLVRAICVVGLLAWGCNGGDDDAATPPPLVDASTVYEVEPFAFDASPPEPNADDSGGPTQATDAQVGADAGSDAGPSRPMRDALDSGVFILDDVRTNLPYLQAVDSGNQDLVVISAHFRMQVLPTLTSVRGYGEIENRGMLERCILLIDATLGTSDLAIVVDTQPYTDVGSTVTTTCLRPGERGAFRAIQNDVPETLLDGNPRFTYAITGLERSFAQDSANPAIVRTERVDKNGYFVIAGTLRAPSTIWNCGIRFYARNAGGLLVSEAPAFPRDLDTISGSTVVDFESGPFSDYLDEPAGLVHFNTYILGMNPDTSSSTVFTARAPSEHDARLQRARAASTEYDRLRTEALP